MKITINLDINSQGCQKVDVKNDDLLKSESGVCNPHAYYLGLNEAIAALIHMQCEENDELVSSFLHRLHEKSSDLTLKLTNSMAKNASD